MLMWNYLEKSVAVSDLSYSQSPKQFSSLLLIQGRCSEYEPFLRGRPSC